MSSLIVWDLETVVDVQGFAVANKLTGKTEAEINEVIGTKFAKHLYHSIVCIGAVIARHTELGWSVVSIGAPHVGSRTEQELITAFVDKIAELKPKLVSFNGHAFDLPVLRYRAMINGVSAPGLTMRPYFNRYTEDAIDLCDVLSSFNSGARASLDEISRIMSLPGKPEGIDGSEVRQLFLDGKIRRSPIIVRATLSTPTGCGCVTNYSEEPSRLLNLRTTNQI
jgi:3'-5' exonuclease